MIRFVTSTIAAALLALPAAASADNYWSVNATFDDGTVLTGDFSVNVYGYIVATNLFTQANGVFTGFNYRPDNTYRGSGPFFIDLEPGYTGDLHLEFSSDLTVPQYANSIVLASSYECQGSFSCYLAGAGAGGDRRYLVAGVASVPEPESWALMIVGFGLAGAVMRRQNTAALISD